MSVLDNLSDVNAQSIELSGEELAYFLETMRRMNGLRKKWARGQVPIERLKEWFHVEMYGIFNKPESWRLKLGPKKLHNTPAVNVPAGNVLRPLLGGRASMFRKYVLVTPSLNDLYWMNAVSSRALEELFIQPTFWADKLLVDSSNEQPEDIESRVRNLLGEELDHTKGPLKMRVMVGEAVPGCWNLAARGKWNTKWNNVYWLIYLDNWLSAILLQWWGKRSSELYRTTEHIMEYEPQWMDRLPIGMEVTWNECIQHFEHYVSESGNKLPIFWKSFAMNLKWFQVPEPDTKVNAVLIAHYLWASYCRMVAPLPNLLVALPQMFNRNTD